MAWRRVAAAIVIWFLVGVAHELLHPFPSLKEALIFGAAGCVLITAYELFMWPRIDRRPHDRNQAAA